MGPHGAPPSLTVWHEAHLALNSFAPVAALPLSTEKSLSTGAAAFFGLRIENSPSSTTCFSASTATIELLAGAVAVGCWCVLLAAEILVGLVRAVGVRALGEGRRPAPPTHGEGL